MNDEFDWEYDYNSPPSLDDIPDYFCNHDWTPIMLIFTTVYNCKKCGKKKEECEVQSGR